MKPSGPLKLIGGLLDLPIVDCHGDYCGIVDDVEFDESGPGAPRVVALLVGPGAYRGRLPHWAFKLIGIIAGPRMTKISWREVANIHAAVQLASDGHVLGLKRSEDRAGHYIPRGGAL
jgi:hypothetical protein